MSHSSVCCSSALPLHVLCSPCPWSVLETRVPHLGAEWGHFGKGCSLCGSSSDVSAQRSSQQGWKGLPWGWDWDSCNYLHIKSVSFWFWNFCTSLLLIAKQSRGERSFPYKRSILEWMNVFTRASMVLFGDWAKTAGDVKVALQRNTTHRFNFVSFVESVLCAYTFLWARECLQHSLDLWLSPWWDTEGLQCIKWKIIQFFFKKEISVFIKKAQTTKGDLLD